MRGFVGLLLGLFGLAWAVWAGTLSALTMFTYLTSNGWGAQLSYGLSWLAATPVFGGLVAAYFAAPLHGWSYLHAAFNLAAWIIPIGLGKAMMEPDW